MDACGRAGRALPGPDRLRGHGPSGFARLSWRDREGVMTPSTCLSQPRQPRVGKFGQAALLGLLSLGLCAPAARAQMTEKFTFAGLNQTVPDGNPVGMSTLTNLSSAISFIANVKVRLNLAGEFNGDLYGYLRHSNQIVVLLNRPGRTAADPFGYDDTGLNVTFDDAAASDIHLYQTVTNVPYGSPLTGTWQPDGRYADPNLVTEGTSRSTSLASFRNLNAAGAWTLYLADLESGGSNQLVSWELEITGGSTPALSWPTPANIVYGTALGSGQLNASVTFQGTNLNGTMTYTPAAGTVLDVGNARPLQVVFQPADTNSFSAITNTVAINVTPAPLTVTAANAARTYGDANPTLTGTITGTKNGDSLSATYATAATLASPVGNYSIIATPAGSRLTNYAVTANAGTLTVTMAPLSVVAANAARAYGDANPTLTGTITGTKNGDVLTATYATPAGLTSPVGNYAITATPAGARLTNYAVSLTSGTLSVTAAPLAVVAFNTNRLYGTTNPLFSGTVTGARNGDSITVTYTTPATLSSPVGSYDIQPVASGSALANYSATLTKGTLTIGRATACGLVQSSSNPARPGQSVTFVITVTPVAPATGVPTGNVQFRVDGAAAGAPAVLTNGVASYTTAALAHGTHTVVAEYAGDANLMGCTNALALSQSINTAPVAAAHTLERYPLQGVKAKLATLLATDTDADGDTLTATLSTFSAGGGSVTVSRGWVFYTPAAGYTNSDSFSYTLSDGFGASVVGTVAVTIKSDVAESRNLSIASTGDGGMKLTFSGIPGRTYTVQYTEDLRTGSWQALGTATANSLGIYEFTDRPPVSSPLRIYRSAFYP